MTISATNLVTVEPPANPSEVESRTCSCNSRSLPTLRVLHVLPFFAYGGTELVVRRLIANLDAPDFEHRVCAMRGYDPQLVRSAQLEDRFVQAGNSAEQLQFPLRRLVGIMRQLQPHIVHTRNWGALEAAFAARLAGVPCVVHSEHGYDLDMLDGLPFRRRVIRRGLYAFVHRLFTVSQELRTFHAKQAWLAVDRLQVVYNGVDTESYFADAAARVQTRKQLDVPEKSLLIGSVGRLVAIKNYPLTLRAVATLVDNGYDVHLAIAGAGPEEENIRNVAAGLPQLQGRLHLCGFTHQTSSFLNGLDIFVQSSEAEGMSNTVLEAMACGLPLVVTGVGGNPEMVAHGENGFLFASGDGRALALHIESLINNQELRVELGRKSRLRAVQLFSLDRTMTEYRNLYQNLAVERGIQVGDKS